MKVRPHKRFAKAYYKLPLKIQKSVDLRLEIFERNPFTPELNNHALSGKYKGYRSINITGDYRAIYIQLVENEVLFVKIGTHAQLYG